MPRVTLSPAAEGDIEEIAAYIAAERPAAALRVISEIEEVLALLARYPELGRARPEIQANYRSIAVQRYVIFYMANADNVEVLRVLHGSRDIDRLL